MIKVHEADGIEPPTTAFAPDAFPESAFYLDAFHTLSTERQLGMGGAGRIPWSKVMLFASEHGLESGDERARFWFLIGAMEPVYLDWFAEKQKAAAKKTT